MSHFPSLSTFATYFVTAMRKVTYLLEGSKGVWPCGTCISASWPWELRCGGGCGALQWEDTSVGLWCQFMVPCCVLAVLGQAYNGIGAYCFFSSLCLITVEIIEKLTSEEVMHIFCFFIGKGWRIWKWKCLPQCRTRVFGDPQYSCDEGVTS